MAKEEDREMLFETARLMQRRQRCHLILGLVFLCLIIVAMATVTILIVTNVFQMSPPPQPCEQTTDSCLISLVESIPENLTYPDGSPSHPSTFTGIDQIINMAQETIEIASFYWTMLPDDLPVQDPSDWEGQKLFNDLVTAGKEKGIKIRIVQNNANKVVPDTVKLENFAGAEVRTLDLKRLIGNGILHTKMWLVDRKHFYVGSANLDWRSLTQVKEMGAVVQQCGCLAADMGKIFDVYWYLAQPDATVPAVWPPSFDTVYNNASQMDVTFNESQYSTFLSSSPPPLCPSGRSKDGDTIVNVINSARKFVYVAVMDYFPTTQFSGRRRQYWPVIDDALRSAAFDRRVSVRLLASSWNHSWPDMYRYLASLQAMRYSGKINVDIEVKLFVVPAFTKAQQAIPYARVNHNKYMVTDKTAYIGTSNWSADYFLSTAGIGLVITPGNHSNSEDDVRQQLQDVFERDWNSQYAFTLEQMNITMTTR